MATLLETIAKNHSQLQSDLKKMPVYPTIQNGTSTPTARAILRMQANFSCATVGTKMQPTSSSMPLVHQPTQGYTQTGLHSSGHEINPQWTIIH
jgi:hypothetical protein